MINMNNRIKELAEQAACDTRKVHNNAYWRMQDEIPEDATWRQRFAELIVKECMSVASKAASLDAEYEAWYLIKQHFGVED